MRTSPCSWRRAAACFLLAAFGTVSVDAAETKPTVQQQIDELQRAVEAQKAQLEAQQKLLEQQAALLEQLRQQAQQPGEAASTAEKVAKLEQDAAQAKLKQQDSARVAITNGRPTITSADGRQARRTSLTRRATVGTVGTTIVSGPVRCSVCSIAAWNTGQRNRTSLSRLPGSTTSTFLLSLMP